LPKQARTIAEILVQIGSQFGSVLWQRAYWYDRMTLAHASLSAAKLLSDWKSVSNFARNIGWIYFYQGDYMRALHWAEEALSATTKTADELLIVAAKRALGAVEFRLGHFDRSEELLRDVLKTSEEFASDDYGIYSKGFAQYSLGELEYERGNTNGAKEWYQKALATWQDPVRKDPVRHISYALNGLGFVALREKQYEEARRLFTEGIHSAREFGRVDELAKGQFGLASVCLETGSDLKTALTLVNESIESFQQQGMQHEMQMGRTLQETILNAQAKISTSQT
jgi:tetratricopeptide (TPR) repeat protein